MKLLPQQNPLEIYNERVTRMNLVSMAPLIFLIFITIIEYIVLYINKGVWLDFRLALTGYIVSIIWYIIVGCLIKQNVVRQFLKSPSTIFRFMFDFPILLLCLIWIIYCFSLLRVFEYPFFITFYVLSVYSASKMVSIQIYTFATNVVGVALIVCIFYYYKKNISTTQYFNLKDIFETFAALYLGLYFTKVQIFFINTIKAIIKFIKFIVTTLLEEE